MVWGVKEGGALLVQGKGLDISECGRGELGG